MPNAVQDYYRVTFPPRGTSKASMSNNSSMATTATTTATPLPPMHLVTAGALSVQFQVSVSKVLRALRSLGAEPAMSLNGVEYFDSDATAAKVRQWLDNPSDH